MAYSQELPLIDVSVLCNAALKEQEALALEVGKEMIARWLRVLTREHIEEKIKEAIKAKKEIALLVDEDVDPLLAPHIPLTRLMREVWPPHTVSVFEHIRSLLDTQTANVDHNMSANHVIICVVWGDPLEKCLRDDPCIPCFLCLCLSCLCCAVCGHH